MSNRMVIAFATLGLPFNGDTIKKQSLGGSETAMICLARALAKRGHRVSVFCECPEPGEFDGVTYYHHSNLVKVSSVTHWDVCVSSRWPEFLTQPVKAGLRILWLHDTLVDQQRLHQQVWQTDAMFLLSDFHIRQYTEGKDEEETEAQKVPYFKKWMWKTSNGVDMDLIRANTRPKVPGKVIYTSRPERGLHYLLQDILPLLLKKHPDLKLHYANYNLQGMQLPQDVAQIIAYSEHLAKQYPNNVVNLGHLTKERLYQEISSAELLLYPTPFPEISPVRGDTLIETLWGQVPIKELVGKSGFQVYSCDEDGKTSISTVRGVFLTRQNAKMLRLRLRPKNGRNARKEKSLYLTPDHEVMLLDGTYRAAGDLRVGDRVKAFHRRKNEWGNGYDTIGVTGQEVVPEHRFVAEKNLGRPLAPGEVVDHLDSNTRNNTFQNLRVWPSHAEHAASHYARMPDDEKDKRTQYLTDWHASMTEEEMRAVKQKAVRARWGDDSLVTWDGRTQSCAAWARELGMSFRGFKYRLENWDFEDVFTTPFPVGDHWKRAGSRKKKAGNHVVVGIEVAENADAYCMEVEPDHNFVANGIVVHNCITAMEAQACGTPIVSTDDFAISETVANGRTGYLIKGVPGEVYTAKFARKALTLLSDHNLRQRMSAEGPKWIEEAGYTWDGVAERWEAKFSEMFRERFEADPIAVVSELVRNHDLVMAQHIVNEHDLGVDLSDRLAVGAQTRAPESAADVVQAFATAKPRFHRVSELMAVSGCVPKVLWDFGCGDSTFGVYAAKAFDSIERIVCVDKDQRVLNRVEAICQQAGIKNVFCANGSSLEELADSGREPPDVIFLGGVLEQTEKPWDLLNTAFQTVKPGGAVVTVTRHGPDTAVLPNFHPRVWNFEQEDFYEMFGEDFTGHLTYVEESLSAGGDLQGYWLCVVPVPHGSVIPVAKPITPTRRERITRPYQRLRCSMIARDAEDWINISVKNLLPICDKIVIALDDRTQDSTEDLLKRLDPTGERIEVRKTKFEDFAQIRNVSIEGEDADWTIWVDTDERIVDGLKLRRYLHSNMMEGFSIKQCHLMLDVHGTYDIPVRLLRNRPHYRFIGCIHEHCEDTSREGFDNPIRPSMLIQDVVLAHYGYLNEHQRRLKCSNRNMELLQKDVEVNGKKGRMLTWVLVMRDHLNITKWMAEKSGSTHGIKRGSPEHQQVEAAIKTYHQHFRDPKCRYHALAFPMYQEALAFLGLSGIPFGNRRNPPFSIALGLAGSVGGTANTDVQAKEAWFLDETEYLEFMERQNKMLLGKLGVVDQQQVRTDLAKPSAVQVEASVPDQELLKLGANAIHPITGRLK